VHEALASLKGSLPKGTTLSSLPLPELRQRLLLAQLLMEAALFRSESRGGHYRRDAAASQPFWRAHSLQQRGRSISTARVVD